MSAEADTIRAALTFADAHSEGYALIALDTLEAERDRYRAALIRLRSPAQRLRIDQGRGLTDYIREALKP